MGRGLTSPPLYRVLPLLPPGGAGPQRPLGGSLGDFRGSFVPLGGPGGLEELCGVGEGCCGVWWVSWSGFFFGVGGLWGWSTWSKANISQFLGGLRGSLEGRGGSLWDFAPWGRGVKAPDGILPHGVGSGRLPMGFCPLGSGWRGSLWEAPYGILPPGVRVGEPPYGILPPGVGLGRLPMGFCPLGLGREGSLWDFAPWGRVGGAPYMGFCPLG